MADWTEPVYDRTQADVDYAIQQLANRINDIEYKGCLNPLDINRIENNTRYLADTLIELYYFNDITTKNNWNESSFPNVYHVERIINNVNSLCKAFYTPDNSPELPETMTHYEDVNNIEECLHLLKVMLDDMVSRFRECGTFNCGEE